MVYLPYPSGLPAFQSAGVNCQDASRKYGILIAEIQTLGLKQLPCRRGLVGRVP